MLVLVFPAVVSVNGRQRIDYRLKIGNRNKCLPRVPALRSSCQIACEDRRG